ncbi:MAG: acyl-CoA dehydrogenase family protein [Saprospiraceae bacterium]|nr:acyl-CoA dehydrogenase family protein [Saprospiraceae bacterium]MDW8484421.1 acyl-CoA dehydrogenase family protein [Saprospiraceae bacterium]
MGDIKTGIAFLKGGEFLVRETQPEEVFIPEELNEEQRMARKMVEDFLEQEVYPNVPKIEKQEDNIVVRLLKKCGDLGLLGAHMPPEYGGMALDTNTNSVISEAFGPAGSFIVAFAAHTGIGMLPILYFGTEEQKQRYLPGLISGDLKAAYCLTEPGSGSDALAAKTRADLSADGRYYILNGQKMWISNAGFADLFIVFAKVGGEKFTGFIVERNTPGITLGAEEDKMGIKGSSTRQVFFENVHVPVENVLGEIGKGHLIAFNALNIGRYKLGIMCIGGCKKAIEMATRYANERHQFGQPIGNFGAIQYKLAEMAIRTFAGESAAYRTSQLMQDRKEAAEAEGKSYGQAMLEAAEEYAIECSILKVYGSEVADYCVDENVQIHGGIGFSEEYPAARAYRDNRINRIYEGTNEINRLLMVDQLFKRAMKGHFDLVGPAWAVQKELASMPSFEKLEGPYAEERRAVSDFKKIILMTAGAAAKMQMDGKLHLKEEQEILINCADMLIDLFVAESMLLRVQKLATRSDKPQSQEIYDAMLQVFLHDVTARMIKNATDALASFAEGDLLKTFLMGLKRFTKYPPVNVKQKRRLVAQSLRQANGWCF